MKIAFIGAGSIVFTKDLLSDLLSRTEISDCEVALMDIDADRLQTVHKMARHMVEQVGAPTRVTATTDRRVAVTNADYVFTTIQVGGLKAFQLDIDIPKRYGV